MPQHRGFRPAPLLGDRCLGEDALPVGQADAAPNEQVRRSAAQLRRQPRPIARAPQATNPLKGTVASGPKVRLAGSKVEPLPVQTAAGSAQSNQSWHRRWRLGTLVEDAGLSGRQMQQCPLDSMPAVRRGLLQVLADAEEVTVSEAARRVGCHRHVARMALEELAAIGLAVCPGLDDDPDDDPELPGRWAAHPWRLAGPDQRLVRAVLAAPPWHEVWPAPPGRGRGRGKGRGGGVGGPHTSCQGPPATLRRSQPSRPPRRRAGLPGLWAAGPPSSRPRAVPRLRRRPRPRPLACDVAALGSLAYRDRARRPAGAPTARRRHLDRDAQARCSPTARQGAARELHRPVLRVRGESGAATGRPPPTTPGCCQHAELPHSLFRP